MEGKHAKENSTAVPPSGRDVAEPGVAAVPLAEPGVDWPKLPYTR